MKNNVKIEICCGTIDDCLNAISNPLVDRIELNSSLELGGITPSVGTLRKIKSLTSIPICSMVRPRTSGFCYSEEQYKVMLDDAKILLENGSDGIVFGFLNKDNTVDKIRTKEFVELIHSYDKEAIFHKAFDLTPDLFKSTEELIELGVDRILTSGKASYPNLKPGLELIRDLIIEYGDSIEILPGGGIKSNNINEVLNITKADQFHMTAKSSYYDNGEYIAVNVDNINDVLDHIN